MENRKEFNAQDEFNYIVKWTREWFANNAPNAPVVVGMSGGKDSTITAGLLTCALGKERVYGVLLPNGEQHDLDVAIQVCRDMGIEHHIINIKNTVENIKNNIKGFYKPTDAMIFNIPPRVRMTYLYAFAATLGGVVVNTSNYSEAYIKYETKWGDMCGDFSLLEGYTVTEVLEIGKVLVSLGVCKNEEYINKTPEDGLTGKADEAIFGFSYKTLDDYIMYGICPSAKDLALIKNMFKKGIHKEESIRLPHPSPRGVWRNGNFRSFKMCAPWED